MKTFLVNAGLTVGTVYVVGAVLTFGVFLYLETLAAETSRRDRRIGGVVKVALGWPYYLGKKLL